MTEHPRPPLVPAADLGPGWRRDATGRAFYSAGWIDGPRVITHPRAIEMIAAYSMQGSLDLDNLAYPPGEAA